MVEPVSVEQARFQARIDDDVEDATVEDLIRDARGWIETYTGHLLTQRQVTVAFDNFDRLRLRAWPIAAASAAVTCEGMTGTIEARVTTSNRPARVLPPIGARWPAVAGGAEAIRVTVTAGYAAAADIPPEMVRAMLLLITAFWVDREGGETMAKAEAAAKALCRPFRFGGL